MTHTLYSLTKMSHPDEKREGEGGGEEERAFYSLSTPMLVTCSALSITTQKTDPLGLRVYLLTTSQRDCVS